jgi:hypothetical protein
MLTEACAVLGSSSAPGYPTEQSVQNMFRQALDWDGTWNTNLSQWTCLYQDRRDAVQSGTSVPIFWRNLLAYIFRVEKPEPRKRNPGTDGFSFYRRNVSVTNCTRYSRFSKVPPIELWHCAALQVCTNILEEHTASIFREDSQEICSSETLVSIYQATWYHNQENHETQQFLHVRKNCHIDVTKIRLFHDKIHNGYAAKLQFST